MNPGRTVLQMDLKSFLSFHSFELLFLAGLGVLPFVIAQRFISMLVISSFVIVAIHALYKKYTFKAISVDKQGVVITGCDTGFGHALAKRLDSLGFIVIAGCLDDKSDGAEVLKKWSDSGRIHVIKLDVTDDESIKAAVETTKQKCEKGLWAVVNNAALNFVGDIEFCTMDQYRKVTEVNYFGVVKVTKAFLPQVRQVKGRIINVTSAKGKLSMPSYSVYGATKYAMESFSDVLRLEMMKFGVKVVIVEPGDFGGTTGMLSPKTLSWLRDEMDKMWSNASAEVKTTYGKEYFESIYTGTTEAAKEAAKTTAPVIDALEDAIVNESPNIRYLVNGGCKLIDYNNFLIRIRSYLRDSWLDYLLDQKYNTPLPPVAQSTK